MGEMPNIFLTPDVSHQNGAFANAIALLTLCAGFAYAYVVV